MAKDRLTLHSKLTALLGSNKVYFQPPASVVLSYPCIVYKRDDSDTIYADGIQYRFMKRYLITVIDKDPDSLIPDKVLALPYCKFVNHFTVDNLNHDLYNIYY